MILDYLAIKKAEDTTLKKLDGVKKKLALSIISLCIRNTNLCSGPIKEDLLKYLSREFLSTLEDFNEYFLFFLKKGIFLKKPYKLENGLYQFSISEKVKVEFLKNHSYFLEVFNGIEHLFKTESEYPYFKNLWNKTDNFKLEELFGFKRFLAASLVLLCIQKKIVIYREVKDFLGFLANQNNLPVEIIDIYVDFYLKNEILFRYRKVTRYESLEDDELTFFISSDMEEDFFREMREMPHRYEEGFFLVNRWFVKNFFEFKKLLKKSKEMIDKNDSFSKSLKLNGYLKIKIPKKAFSLFAIYVKYLIKLDIKDDTVENLYDLMCRTVQLALITAVNYQLNNNYGVYPSLHRNLLIKYKEAYGDNEDNLIELKISINNNLGDYLFRYLEYLLNSNGPYTSLVLTCDTPDFSKFWLKEKYFGDFFFKEFLTTGLKILAENVEKALMEKEKSIQISDVVLPSMFLN